MFFGQLYGDKRQRTVLGKLGLCWVNWDVWSPNRWQSHLYKHMNHIWSASTSAHWENKDKSSAIRYKSLDKFFTAKVMVGTPYLQLQLQKAHLLPKTMLRVKERDIYLYFWSHPFIKVRPFVKVIVQTSFCCHFNASTVGPFLHNNKKQMSC